MRAAALVLALGLAGGPSIASRVQAQDQAAAPATAAQAPQGRPGPVAEPGDDPDLEPDPAEPDFTVIALPTNLRLPLHALSLRLTHRFGRPLNEGSFSDLAADLFGFDGGAQIGLGLRFGLLRGNQVAVYRTSDRTIQLSDQQQLLREGPSPIGVSLLASVEGLDNFHEDFSPAVAMILSRRLGDRGAVYLVPSWVGNTRVNPSAPGTDSSSTLVLGIGARFRVSRKLSLVGEVHPRLAGYKGDLGSGDPKSLISFGIESRVGGHAFQLSFSNAQGTTPAQVARGQAASSWFIGFNLTRKFF